MATDKKTKTPSKETKETTPKVDPKETKETKETTSKDSKQPSGLKMGATETEATETEATETEATETEALVFVKDPLDFPRPVPKQSTKPFLGENVDLGYLKPNTINDNRLQENLVNCVQPGAEPAPTRDSFKDILTREYTIKETVYDNHPALVPNPL